MKNDSPVIKTITAPEAWSIRQQVMWPDKPLTYVQVSNDAEGQHFSVCINDQIVSIVSLFITNNEAQFRKLATLREFQGLGYGTLLLQHIIAIAKKEGIQKLWCNARIEKSSFYKRFGLTPSETTFQKGGIAYVIMEKKLLVSKEKDTYIIHT